VEGSTTGGNSGSLAAADLPATPTITFPRLQAGPAENVVHLNCNESKAHWQRHTENSAGRITGEVQTRQILPI
jgi:hypothetical protein